MVEKNSNGGALATGPTIETRLGRANGPSGRTVCSEARSSSGPRSDGRDLVRQDGKVSPGIGVALWASCLGLLGVLYGMAPAAQGQELVAAELQGELLRLEVDGGLKSVRHFVLEDPPRLVLDLHGIRSTSTVLPDASEADSVAGVRTGRHRDKLRVVVDFERALRAYRVRRSKRVVEVELDSDLSKAPPDSVHKPEEVAAAERALRLETDGGLENVRHFVMADPPRLVLDLYGVQDVSVALNSAPDPLSIEGLRKARHLNKIRVVIDFERPLEAYRVRRSGSVVGGRHEVGGVGREAGRSPTGRIPTGGAANLAGCRYPPTPPALQSGPAALVPPAAPGVPNPWQDTDPIGTAIRGMLTHESAYSVRQSRASAVPVAGREEPIGPTVVQRRN